MDDTQLLRRCPFCGKAAELRETKHIPDGVDYTPRCKDPSCIGRSYKKFTSKEDAIAMWNKRPYFCKGDTGKRGREIDCDRYIISCNSFTSATMLYGSLCSYLYEKGISYRVFKKRLVINIPASNVALRFMSVQSPQYTEALADFHGKLVNEIEVEKWLLSYEKFKKS